MLKHLNLDEMAALTEPLTKKTSRRRIFLSIPEIAALLPKIVKAHQGVVAVRPVDANRSPELQAFIDKGTEEDKRHDAFARAVSLGLEAQAAYCLAQDPPDAEGAMQCEQARGKLFPTGTLIVNASLLAEFGNTTRIARLLKDEPAIGELLKTIPVKGNKTLFDTMQGWLASGARLGKIEHDREEYLAKQTAAPVTKATIQEVRSRWFRVVSLVLANLNESDAPAEDIEAVRGPIVRASDRAGQRYATGKTDEPVMDSDEGAGDDQEGAAGA
jgi:hypothetical protein